MFYQPFIPNTLTIPHHEQILTNMNTWPTQHQPQHIPPPGLKPHVSCPFAPPMSSPATTPRRTSPRPALESPPPQHRLQHRSSAFHQRAADILRSSIGQLGPRLVTRESGCCMSCILFIVVGDLLLIILAALLLLLLLSWSLC